VSGEKGGDGLVVPHDPGIAARRTGGADDSEQSDNRQYDGVESKEPIRRGAVEQDDGSRGDSADGRGEEGVNARIHGRSHDEKNYQGDARRRRDVTFVFAART
jgi:hypothetical protein